MCFILFSGDSLVDEVGNGGIFGVGVVDVIGVGGFLVGLEGLVGFGYLPYLAWKGGFFQSLWLVLL